MIEDAFVSLVLEHGYSKVAVEDVVATANVAKATFYAHFDNKEAVVTAVFSRLVREMTERAATREAPWTEVRYNAMRAVFEHAADMRDIYTVCLADARARSEYIALVAGIAEESARLRLEALGRTPRVPIAFMATAYAGAHVALLESWLNGDLTGSPQEIADMQLDLMIRGFAWAHDISPDELSRPDSPGA